MKRVREWLTVAAVAVVLPLAGCSTGWSDLTGMPVEYDPPFASPTDRALTPAEEAQWEAYQADLLFLRAAAQVVPRWKDGDSQKVELGRGVCDLFRAGQSLEQVGPVVVEGTGLSERDAGSVMVLAQSSFCPDTPTPTPSQ